MPQILTTKSRGHLNTTELITTRVSSLVNGEWQDQSVNVPLVVPTSGVYESLTSVGHRGPPYKDGGPFQLKRFSFTIGSAKAVVPTVYAPDNITEGASRYVSSGRCTTDPFNLSLAGLSIPTDVDGLKARHDAISFPSIDLNTFGTQGIARFSPLKPGVNMGQFLGELRDLPKIPKLLRKKLQFFKNLGSDYINLEFGWKPFVKDLQDFYTSWNDLDSRMKQIVRDNGLPVRRRGSLSSTKSTDTSIVGCVHETYPQITPYSSDYSEGEEGRPTLVTTIVSEDIWFAARMRYFLPWTPTDEWPLRAKLALFGINPTPSLIYELMPWSWLIDWYSNLGEVLTNLSSNGIAELVSDYAYCMRHNKTVTSASSQHHSVLRYNSMYPEFSIVAKAPAPQVDYKFTWETKERVAATPFGFGLQLDDLSVRQYAILIALGLSRQNFI